jgi:hypothetical protein
MRRRKPHFPGTPAIPEGRAAYHGMIGSRESGGNIDILERVVIRYGTRQDDFDNAPLLRSILRRKGVQ